MDSIHLSPQYAKGILLYPSSNNLFFHAVKFLSIFSVNIFYQEHLSTKLIFNNVPNYP